MFISSDKWLVNSPLTSPGVFLFAEKPYALDLVKIHVTIKQNHFSFGLTGYVSGDDKKK